MKKNINSKILDLIVALGIILTLISLLGTPLVLTAFFKTQLLDPEIYHSLVVDITACIYICAVPYLIALFKLKRLCKLVVKNNPFSIEVPKSLKIISTCAFSEVILFNGCLAYLYYLQNIYLYALTVVPAIIVTFVSIFIGFLGLVLAQLFEKAIAIKEENDKTI
ncbi:protein of unknown function DUF2975 [Gottschalkia purinilytica]|uniref:DUF2975 domain-containing protein n=1 Tax=Gottschalkia purinilytica TaxID=1503 RepID=A0A0L0WAE5_GOTPU|nr:DUF2975 domain-containing protein [Gottschalkia purinilytica]KNF08295.1 protein of unknown function DUF2975 [Gottschalkia purinilytica]